MMKMREKYLIFFFISYSVILVKSKDFRLPTNAVPRSYKLFINPDLTPGNFMFETNVDIDLEILEATKNLTLHSSNLTIYEYMTTLTYDITTIRPIRHIYQNDTEFLILDFGVSLFPRNYTLKMKFYGYLSEEYKGFFRDSYQDDKNQTIYFAATHFEPTFARRAFPCWDEPALKAIFEITILHYQNYTVLSNMPKVPHIDNPSPDEKTWTRFQWTPLLSTYTLALTISNFEKKFTNEYGNFSVWARKSIATNKTVFGANVGEKALKLLETFSGIPYTLPKMDFFILPNFEVSGMENWGLILFKERSFLVKDMNIKVLLEKSGRIVCHEIIHQWIGNLISPAWWTDLWITEGLPSYYQNSLLDRMNLSNITNTATQQMNSVMYDAILEEERLGYPPLYPDVDNAANIFTMNSAVYTKGPIMFHILSNIITKNVLDKSIKETLEKYKFNSLTTNQFFDIIQANVDKTQFLYILYGSFNVTAFMRPYLTQIGYPVITVNRNIENETITLTQECFICLVKNAEDKKWPMAISYTTESKLHFEHIYNIHWFQPSMNELIITNVSSSEWIIFNLQMSGYYRVIYDDYTWQQLADYLNSDKFENIHPMNRLQLLLDAGWLFERGKMRTDLFYQLLNYIKREESPIVWAHIPDIILRCMLHANYYIYVVYTKIIEELETKQDVRTTGIGIMKFCDNFPDDCRSVFGL